MVPKLFGPIRERYLNRPGGYTRVLRIEPLKEDQAESAILELVDGPKDMRFAMTAKTLARMPQKRQLNAKTSETVKKATQFRQHGMRELRQMVGDMRILDEEKIIDKRILPPPRKVYPEPGMKREMHYYEDYDEKVAKKQFIGKKQIDSFVGKIKRERREKQEKEAASQPVQAVTT